jgi:hypothetical protein
MRSWKGEALVAAATCGVLCLGYYVVENPWWFRAYAVAVAATGLLILARIGRLRRRTGG